MLPNRRRQVVEIAALTRARTLAMLNALGHTVLMARAAAISPLSVYGQIKWNSTHCEKRNSRKAALIFPDAGRVKVSVIRTDENFIIARHTTTRILNPGSIRKA